MKIRKKALCLCNSWELPKITCRISNNRQAFLHPKFYFYWLNSAWIKYRYKTILSRSTVQCHGNTDLNFILYFFLHKFDQLIQNHLWGESLCCSWQPQNIIPDVLDSANPDCTSTISRTVPLVSGEEHLALSRTLLRLNVFVSRGISTLSWKAFCKKIIKK